MYPPAHHQLDWDVEVPDGEVRIISDHGRDFIMLDLVSTSRVRIMTEQIKFTKRKSEVSGSGSG